MPEKIAARKTDFLKKESIMNVAIGYGYSVYFTRLANLLKAKTERIRRHFPRKPSISPFFRHFLDPFSHRTKQPAGNGLAGNGRLG